MRFLYPADFFHLRRVDETFEEEYQAAMRADLNVSLFSFEDFQEGALQPKPRWDEGEQVIYRGWMLDKDGYQKLVSALEQQGASAHTSLPSYLKCHHLPGWYESLREFTSETRFFSADDDIASALHKEGWTGCFLKDHVKSLSTGEGSLVTDLTRLPEIIATMQQYRGTIEGGICARRIERYINGSERRYFVFHGQIYSDGDEIPHVARIAAERIDSPFFSVDTATRDDGVIRVIELGDGQVSDRKHWAPDRFMEIFQTVGTH